MNLNTLHIEDWAEFVNKYDIDLTCDECEGACNVETTKVCHVCAGTGDDPVIADEECAHCKGAGELTDEEECQECDGTGMVEPMWNTVWDTGYGASYRDFKRKPAPNVFAFEHEGNVWFGLTCCGMDCTPYLALAWINTFPDCQWMPENFWVGGCNLSGGYIKSCVGEADALRIYKVMQSSAELEIDRGRVKLDSVMAVLEKTGQPVGK